MGLRFFAELRNPSGRHTEVEDQDVDVLIGLFLSGSCDALIEFVRM